jgi:L-alanine-DL-glutamate epimerase-like enolase superfamily enzyme
MPHFDIRTERLPLTLAEPFTIARGTKETVENVVVHLSADGVTGHGEAAPNARYNENADKVIAFIKSLSKDFFDDISTAETLTDELYVRCPQVQSAMAAIEMAWLDWWGKKQDTPLWQLWETSSNRTPPTSYTIGLDTLEVMQDKVRAALKYPILKVKLGTNRDQDIIRAIREVTDKPIRVDANEGWTSL